MRIGIAAKLALLLALVGVLAAGLTGVYSYRASRALLIDSAKDKLLTSTLVLARRITQSRTEISRNLQILSQHPAALRVLQSGDPAAAEQLATLFRGVMVAHPAYFQLRLIAADEHGMERVRVDRQGDALVEVGGDALQEKGHFPYVAETLQLAAGETYLSRVTINHEVGSHAGLDQPLLQLAMPVVGPAPAQAGTAAAAKPTALGIVVVNVDLEGTFALLAADLPPAFRLYLANGDGDILIHPDSSKTFGFDKGRRVLLQDEFPAVRPLVERRQGEVVVETAGAGGGPPLVAAFIGRDLRQPSSDGRLLLGLAQPLSQVLAQTDRLGLTIAQIVLGLCLACLLLATVLARAFTRPINAMSVAAQNLAAGQAPSGLPLQRRDEIGTLARSFRQMQALISDQLTALQTKQASLEHLSLHDMLTGLANRRLFEERLEQALAQARRHGGEVCLLFVDLDGFKGINDAHGHDAGDAALKAVAVQLQGRVREVDTVARLGGDEFVVLLGDAPAPAHLAALAQKLLDGVHTPLTLASGQTLVIGASIGIARCPEDGTTARALLASADQAMYEAKAAGRGGFRFASPLITADAAEADQAFSR